VDRPSNAPEACVGPASEQAGKASACEGCPNQAACASGAGKQVDPAIAQVQERMREVKHKILVLSGKGGVGKSTVSAQLAWTLASQGYSVGLLDIDICGPSAPRMLGVEGHEVRKSNFGWSPVYASENLAVMSVAFMLQGRNDAVIWRGPRKNGLIKQFLTDVEWGPLDFLVVDAPPGTSDEHISICQYLTACGVDGAVIVTTPQEMSLLDVRKEISFTAKVGVRVLGVVENMAGFACPSCKTTSDIFPAVTGGARAMSAEMKVPFLGSLPIDPLLLQSCEEGKCYVETHPTAPAVQPLLKLVDTLLDASPQLKQTKQERLAEANVNMADSAAPAASAAAAPAAPAASATALASSCCPCGMRRMPRVSVACSLLPARFCLRWARHPWAALRSPRGSSRCLRDRCCTTGCTRPAKWRNNPSKPTPPSSASPCSESARPKHLLCRRRSWLPDPHRLQS